MSGIKFTKDDGGRSAAGFKGDTGDCVTRAIAIATGIEYKKVRKELMQRQSDWRTTGSRKAKRQTSNSVRNGCNKEVYEPYLDSLGWEKESLVKFGWHSRSKMTAEDMPRGVVIMYVQSGRRGHLATMIDHVLHDSWDCRESFKYENNVPTRELIPKTVLAIWRKKTNG